MFFNYSPGIFDPHADWKLQINTNQSLDGINASLKNQTGTAIAQSKALSEVIISAKRDYVDAIGQMSEEITSSLNYCTSLICGTLNDGFETLSNDIQEVGRCLDFKLTLVHEQIVLSNIISENIALLLRIPDIQKERQYHLEQGLKHLNNALIDSDFYENALENLLEAEKREKTDYFVLHHLGIIYLYSPKFLDPEKAESYFRKAGKFAKVESDPKAVRLADLMSGSVLSKLSKNVPDAKKMQFVSAESYLQGALACFIQSKFLEAAEMAQTAFELAPELTEAAYYACLSNAAIEKSDLSIKYLDKLVIKDPNYSIIAATEPLLASKKYIKDWLANLRDNSVKAGIETICDIFNNAIMNSYFLLDLKQAEDALREANYIDSLKIKEYLAKELHCENEKEMYKENMANLTRIKKLISQHNEYCSNLRGDAELTNPTILTFDEGELIKGFMLNDSRFNQWEISEKIFGLGKKLAYSARDNFNKIQSSAHFKSDSAINIEEKRKKYATAINKNQKAVKYVGGILTFIGGFIGCIRTANLPDNGGSLMAPFGVFFLVAIIGIVVLLLIIEIMKNEGNKLRTGSKNSIQLFQESKELRETSSVFENLAHQLNGFHGTSLPNSLVSFNEFRNSRIRRKHE